MQNVQLYLTVVCFPFPLSLLYPNLSRSSSTNGTLKSKAKLFQDSFKMKSFKKNSKSNNGGSNDASAAADAGSGGEFEPDSGSHDGGTVQHEDRREEQ